MSMCSKPAADIIVTPPLVQALLQEQHPDLAHLEPVPVAEGWDNALFRLGDNLAVRVPRRAVAAALIAHEQRWLPNVAARLPLPTPAPVRVGVPGRVLPWPWSIVPWLPGSTLLDGAVIDDVDAAATLERFLLALHQPAPPEAPRNPWRGVLLSKRTASLHEHLQHIDGLVDRRRVLNLWERAVATPPWSRPPVWLHGDLHPGNLLAHEGRLSAVIDFGDITSGDPATDLAVLWMLPQSIRARYTAWAEDPPDALRMRARGWALALGMAYLSHASEDEAMARLGQRTIAAALTEE